MRNFIIGVFLKNISFLLSVMILMMGSTQLSFADTGKKGNSSNLYQSSDDDDCEDDEDEDDDDEEEDDEDDDEEDGEDDGDDGDDDDDEDDDDESHNAGKNCLTGGCHAEGSEHRFYLGGTIYRDSDGTASLPDAEIKVEDADGNSFVFRSDHLGNFYTERRMNAPFTISASYRGHEVEMPTTAPDGGCNADGCHSAGGVGRIFISTNDPDLSSTVVDVNTGKTVSRARVKLSQKGRVKYRAITDATGRFVLKRVKAGRYALRISKKGYKTVRQHYRINQDSVTPLEILMRKKE